MSSWTKTDLRNPAKASADTSFVIVAIPSVCLRGPIVCFTFCYCLMYLCSPVADPGVSRFPRKSPKFFFWGVFNSGVFVELKLPFKNPGSAIVVF